MFSWGYLQNQFPAKYLTILVFEITYQLKFLKHSSLLNCMLSTFALILHLVFLPINASKQDFEYHLHFLLSM